jgi:DNA-binding transcriptional LysR family regulator
MGPTDSSATQQLRQLNLNLLIPLEALLRTQNVTHAARELHLSQSAMSAVLAKLRAGFGDPLLVKCGRGMALTLYAETLVVPLQETLQQIQDLLTHRPAFDPAVDSRDFTIIASDYTTLILLRPLLETLVLEAPAVRVRLQAVHDDFHERVRSGEADLALVSEQLCMEFLPGFPCQIMYEDRFVACAWKGNPDFGQPVALGDFQRLPFVQYVTGERPNIADHALDELDVARRIEIRTESQLLVPYLLTRTPLAAVVPERLARSAADAAELALADCPVPLPTIRDAAVWHPRCSGDAAHQWLVERLRHVAAAL